MDPLNREIEVLVGPLPDYKGGGNEAVAVRFFADGTTDKLRIKFNIQKHMVSTASPSVVSIYNLSRDLRNAILKSPGTNVSVYAGWSNFGRQKLFSGGMVSSVSQRQGADIVTDISFLAGYGSKARGITSKTFNAGATLASIVEDVATNMPGISVDQSKRKTIDIKDFVVGSGGLALAGSTADTLDGLARRYGFSWWIEDGTFFALDDDRALSGNSVLITSENGFLKRAEPILSSPFQQQAGVTVNSLFNPLINVGRVLTVESDINPNVSGSYKVHSLTHSGDSHSSSWDTSVESHTYGLASS